MMRNGIFISRQSMDKRTLARLSRILRRKGVKIGEGKEYCRVSRLGFLAGSRGGGLKERLEGLMVESTLFIYNIYRS